MGWKRCGLFPSGFRPCFPYLRYLGFLSISTGDFGFLLNVSWSFSLNGPFGFHLLHFALLGRLNWLYCENLSLFSIVLTGYLEWLRCDRFCGLLCLLVFFGFLVFSFGGEAGLDSLAILASWLRSVGAPSPRRP